MDAINRGRAVINLVIYAELSVSYASASLTDDAIPPQVEREDIPYEAGFLAGKAFRAYRRNGGTRRSPLPDFFIGAHAMVRGYDLLTRDPARYRTYFPAVRLIEP
ncbi:MAG TPA: type II toxin-antitoxin system VapC family toxin [Rhizomicrobium sp.]|nr:type II toxin-antitoxin system VapC family toxin [Rhizomicrobium sp.]